MTIDYAAVTADLHTKRDAIDAIIGGFQRLLGTAQAAVAPVALPPARKPKPAARVMKATPSAATPRAEKFARMRRSIEAGESVEAVAKGAGMTIEGVMYHVRKKGWKVQKRPPAAIQTEHKGPIPTGRRLGVMRRCDCGQKTIMDPCQFCGLAA